MPTYQHRLTDYSGWTFICPVPAEPGKDVTAHVAKIRADLGSAFPGATITTPADPGEVPRVISPDGRSHVDTGEYETMMDIFQNP